jgi:cyclic beta-1,2-glucan synthetase
MHVVTEADPDTGALLARNPFRVDQANRVAFADINRRPRTFSADRTEFLGRHGSVADPAALSRIDLSGRTGAGIDPCAAIQTRFALDPDESTEIIFLLGETENLERVRTLVRRYWDSSAVAAALANAIAEWDRILDSIQVDSPDPAFNLLFNRWLLYQVISCRLQGRSGFYQSSGAYGFRDQLQDVLSLLHTAPTISRAHILYAASRQFVEGDVQHWWHPSGEGVRTRISDDMLWLPYATSLYVKTTGDSSILDEVVPFLNAPMLEPGQEDDYRRPMVSDESGSLGEHCRRAIEYGTRTGPHGLPLMGRGDWNDGMNRVGADGRGESIWLAWFLIHCLRSFADILVKPEDGTRAAKYRDRADALRVAIENCAWDGDWYIRAFFDDGTRLGSAQAAECQIDSIAQTWGVISGAADPERCRRAMQSVHDRLVDRENGLILLLTPPFDDGPLDPGYIKGYPPGIRENGAQYTHAATWVIQATALLGQGRLAFALYQDLNPILHTRDHTHISCYQVEPYVVAGDVYSQPPHVGRGGWTWYTGAAGWLYRVGLGSILGLQRSANCLTLDPCVSPDWIKFTIRYRFGSSTYHIAVENPERRERGVAEISLDGQPCNPEKIPLADDGRVHQLRVVMGVSRPNPNQS